MKYYWKILVLFVFCLFSLLAKETSSFSYYDERNDRALFFTVEGESYRIHHCDRFKGLIERDYFFSKIKSLSESSHCREITTKFLPVHISELKRLYQSRGNPKVWQGQSFTDFIGLINNTGFQNLDPKEYDDLLRKVSGNFDRRNLIAKNKVTTFRLRVQSKEVGQNQIDSSRPYSTCTASYIKIDGECHLFTNEHCVQSKPSFLEIDIPELSDIRIEVQEDLVATEWDMMTLKTMSPIIKNQFCKNLEDQNQKRFNELAHSDRKAFYSLGYSGRSGQTKMDIFSTKVDETPFAGADPHPGSIRKTSYLEFPEGKASRYNYIPVYRGMSGGVLTDEDGSPLCLIHKTVPQQDTPQCVDLRDMRRFIDGELPRANVLNRDLDPNIFKRTYRKFDLEKFVKDPLDNRVAPGNSYISPGNTQVPPTKLLQMNNTYIPPGNTSIPPGNTSIPPGNTSIPPGNTSIPPNRLYGSCWQQVLAQQLRPFTLDPFIEALEGIEDYVISSDESPKELLAVRCGPFSPWEQIDGREDYIHKLVPYNSALGGGCPNVLSLREEDKIYRDEEGYVPEKYRKDLLERLKGAFFTRNGEPPGLLNSYDYAPSSNSLITADSRKTVGHGVHIDPETSMIQVSLGTKPGPFVGEVLEAKFKVEFSQDGKSIKLRPTEFKGNFPGKNSFGEMNCENKNFMKLICQGSNHAFSLSMTRNQPKTLAVRFSSYDPISNKLIHTHGDIHENLSD